MGSLISLTMPNWFDDMALAVAPGTDENATPTFFGVYEGIESGK